MLKRLGGFKANAKLPPLLIPALPCQCKTNELCNGWFIPSMSGQKSCLHCLNYTIEKKFPINIKREQIVEDITVTWVNEKEWVTVRVIILENETEYNKHLNYF